MSGVCQDEEVEGKRGGWEMTAVRTQGTGKAIIQFFPFTLSETGELVENFEAVR